MKSRLGTKSQSIDRVAVCRLIILLKNMLSLLSETILVKITRFLYMENWWFEEVFLCLKLPRNIFNDEKADKRV